MSEEQPRLVESALVYFGDDVTKKGEYIDSFGGIVLSQVFRFLVHCQALASEVVRGRLTSTTSTHRRQFIAFHRARGWNLGYEVEEGKLKVYPVQDDYRLHFGEGEVHDQNTDCRVQWSLRTDYPFTVAPVWVKTSTPHRQALQFVSIADRKECDNLGELTRALAESVRREGSFVDATISVDGIPYETF